MTIESAADRATFLADFGSEATWTLAGGGSSTLTGIVEDAAGLMTGMVESGYVASGPSFLFRTADMPVGGAQGDTLVVDGVTWKIVSVLPDGTGISRATLERGT